MYQSGKIINGLSGFDKIRLEGNAHPIHDQTDKYWMKGTFMCENFIDGPSCNGCRYRCGESGLFVKIYEGNDPRIIQAMENHGSIQISSAYIAKTYGIVREEGNIFVVTEYITGKSVSDFCKEMSGIKNAETGHMLTDREMLVLKYRLMRQMLYAVRDYQKYRQDKLGVGVHLDLKSEHFIVVRGERWDDVQIKLIDFEAFTNYNQQPPTFQVTPEYAHPTHKRSFDEVVRPTQIKPAWDYYGLGLVFYEMLEGEMLFSTEERMLQKYSQNQDENMKGIYLNRHEKDMEREEYQEITKMLRRMISLSKPWETIEELISYMNRFINRWIRKKEAPLMRSSELLMREEYDFWYAPYINVQFEVKIPGQTTFYQSYEIMEGGIISLAYNANLPIWGKMTKTAAYLLENEGDIDCFLLEQEEMIRLCVGKTLVFDECILCVMDIRKVGYKQKTVSMTGSDIDVM